MPDHVPPALLDRLNRLLGHDPASIARAKTKIASDRAALGGIDPFPAGPLVDDHPLVGRVGREAAQRFADQVNGVLHGRHKVAADRRVLVITMSREHQPVRDIASATGLRYASVVKLRVALRREGAIS